MTSTMKNKNNREEISNYNPKLDDDFVMSLEPNTRKSFFNYEKILFIKPSLKNEVH